MLVLFLRSNNEFDQLSSGKLAQELTVNSGSMTRTLLLRLVLLFAGLGLAISTWPGIYPNPASENAAQLAFRQRLSLQLNNW